MPEHFPARNRIVAGMADAVVVVEASLKGGALITAEIANPITGMYLLSLAVLMTSFQRDVTSWSGITRHHC